jgi:hypothetical protein
MTDFQVNILHFCHGQQNLQELNLLIWFPSDVGSTIVSRLLIKESLKKLTFFSFAGLPAIEAISNESLEDLRISYRCPRSVQIIPTWRTLFKMQNLKNLEISFQGDSTFQSPHIQEIIRHCSRSRKLQALKLNKTRLFGHETAAFHEINLPKLRKIDFGT